MSREEQLFRASIGAVKSTPTVARVTLSNGMLLFRLAPLMVKFTQGRYMIGKDVSATAVQYIERSVHLKRCCV